MALEKEKRVPEAIAFYREALKRRSDDPIAANNLAWLLSEGGGNIDEALKWAQLSKEKAPNDPAIGDTLGWIYMKKNNSSLAISEFRDAVGKAPKNPLYLYHLGVAQWKAGDTRQAEQNISTALATNIDFPGVEDARKTLKEIQAIKL
jgi:Flp pilus assembly protein TadD